MKIGIFLTGVFLIIGAVLEFSFSPVVLDKVNRLPDNLETSVISVMSNNPENRAYTSMITDANVKASQLTSSMMMLETKVTDYTSSASMLMGLGFVVYGVLAKNNNGKQSNNTEALGVLKMRLAKGEITKSQFNQLKNDVK